jgi:hypothetical protein
VRATEVHRYKVVLIENVVEAASWELFDIWLAAMDKLGCNHQFVSVSSAHIGDETNPQARNGATACTSCSLPSACRCPTSVHARWRGARVR